MARQPDPGSASFLDEVRKLRARVDRLTGASPLTGSGMSVPAAGVLKVTGRLDVAGGLSYSSAWASAVVYRAGQLVVEPGGTLVTAKADHTSGNTFDPAKWTPVTPSPWRSYTPVLTAVTTNPSLGTGVALGAYQQSGKTVVYQGQIPFGSGMSAGSGVYDVSVPAAANTTRWPYRRVGVWTGFHAVTGGRVEGVVAFDGAASALVLLYRDAYPVGNLVYAGSATPWVWAQSDAIDFAVTYEAA